MHRSFEGKGLNSVQGALDEYVGLSPLVRRLEDGLITLEEEKRHKTEIGRDTEVGTDLKCEGEIVIIRQGVRNSRLARKVFQEAPKRVLWQRFCTVAIEPKRTFLALYDATAGPLQLLCADTESGAIVWKAKAWGLGEMVGGFSGAYPEHVLTIVPGEKSIVIFGYSFARCYVEGFDATTGACSFRFSTEYWRCGG